MAARKIDHTLAEILDEIDWTTSVAAGKTLRDFQQRKRQGAIEIGWLHAVL